MKKIKRFLAIAIILLITLLITGCKKNDRGRISSLEDLQRGKIGVITGSIYDSMTQEKIPDCQIEYFSTLSDMITALSNKKIDALVSSIPAFIMASKQNPEIAELARLKDDYYAYIFGKGENVKLREELDEYITKAREEGSLEQVIDKWMIGEESEKVIDTSGLTGENGTVRVATSFDIGEPFEYIKDGVAAGYEIDILYGFCREYGYRIELKNYSFAGTLAAVSSGKCDIGCASISITPEREQALDYSTPNYESGIVVVVYDPDNNSANSGIADRFRKTFLQEDRWKLFVSGVGVTLLITGFSVLFGTIAGFIVYLFYRKGNKVFNMMVKIISDILQKTPTVVILMILFYVIFGNAEINEIIVAIIGFSIMFAFGFVGVIDVGVNSIDRGQTEASLALGYKDDWAFIRIIFPQAVQHFLPVYLNNVISLLMNTAVVGYIAIQDLTKMGDIVRSRTFDAFFPLISIAVIYYGLAWLLTFIVKIVQRKTDTRIRSKEEILKGVVQNDKN